MKLHSFDLSQDSKKKEKELLDLAVDILSSILGNSKGQIISECPYEIIVYPKIATKKFPRFLP